MSRFQLLTDDQWELIADLMPGPTGRKGRPFADARTMVEGIIYRYRCGIAWRDLPEAFGPWQTVWRWHRRMAGDGAWDQVQQRLHALADRGGSSRRGLRRSRRTARDRRPVHGEGLYLGVELVRDRATMEPAKEEAAAICERLKELGVIVLTTSERSNVLKVKPPLCLTVESADFVVAQLDRVLTEGW